LNVIAEALEAGVGRRVLWCDVLISLDASNQPVTNPNSAADE